MAGRGVARDGGDTPVPIGPDAFAIQTGRNQGGPHIAIRFVLDGEKVVAQKLWSHKRGSQFSHSGAFHPADKTILRGNHRNRNHKIIAVSAADGEVKYELDLVKEYGWPSLAIADGKLFVVNDLMDGPRRGKQTQYVWATIQQIAGNKRLCSVKLRDGLPPEDFGAVTSIAPKLFPTGEDPGMQETGFHPYGNVLLLRIKGALICWGKPGKYEAPKSLRILAAPE